MAIDDPLGDGEPQARALRSGIARVVGAVEPLERVSCGFLVHADALVLNAYVDRARARIRRYAKCDGRSRIRVLGGVLHDHAQSLLHERYVDGRVAARVAGKRSVRSQPIRVLGIDHLRFFAYLADQCSQVGMRAPQDRAPGIAACQKQQLFHELLHVLAFGLEGRDRLRQHVRVVFAPAVEHVYVALNHRDGRAQLVARVVDKAHLLQLGLLHLTQQTVECDLDARQVGVASGDARRIDTCSLDGLLQRFHLAAGELHAAELVHAQGQVVERCHGAAHASGAAEHVEHADDLPTYNDKVERPQRDEVLREGEGLGGTRKLDGIGERCQVPAARGRQRHAVNGGAGDPSCGKRAVGQRLVVSIDEDRRRNHHQQQIEPDVAHQAAPHVAPVDGAGDGSDALGLGATRGRHSPPRARSG